MAVIAGAEEIKGINAGIADHCIRTGKIDLAKEIFKQTGCAEPHIQPTAALKRFIGAAPLESDAGMGRERFPSQSSVPLSAAFQRLYALGNPIDEGNVQPALRWCAEHRSELRSNKVEGIELELQTVHIIQLLRGRLWTPIQTPSAGGSASTLPNNGLVQLKSHFMSVQLAQAYLRDTTGAVVKAIASSTGDATAVEQHLAHLATVCMFARAAATSGATGNLQPPQWNKQPYAAFFAPELLSNTKSAFISACCAVLGLSYESPLHQIMRAATIALPYLLQYQQMATLTHDGDGKPEYESLLDRYAVDGEVPVEAPMPPDLQFHSVFVCPVSKQQCDPAENPPMLLACGHVRAQPHFLAKYTVIGFHSVSACVLQVISEESMQRIASTRVRFKCPTCPVQQTPQQAMALKI
jgi:hypothetical protein